MLRLIGAVVVAVLLVGPLLAQAGVLENAGWFRDLVDLEVRGVSDLVHWSRTQPPPHPEQKPPPG